MLSEMFSWIVGKLVETIGSMGYTGIVGLMFLESSFFSLSKRSGHAAGRLPCT